LESEKGRGNFTGRLKPGCAAAKAKKQGGTKDSSPNRTTIWVASLIGDHFCLVGQEKHVKPSGCPWHTKKCLGCNRGVYKEQNPRMGHP